MKLIDEFSKNDLVKGLPKIKYDHDMTCEPSQKGMLIKSSFHRKFVVPTMRLLEL